MAEKNGNGQQGVDLFVMLHSEMRGILATLDRQGAQLRHFEEEMMQFFASQKQVNSEMQSHFHRIAEMLITVGDRLNDHDRRLAALESKAR